MMNSNPEKWNSNNDPWYGKTLAFSNTFSFLPQPTNLHLFGAVNINSDGTIEVLKEGKEPLIAAAFWSLMRQEMIKEKSAQEELKIAKQLLRDAIKDDILHYERDGNFNSGYLPFSTYYLSERTYIDILNFLHPK